MNEKIKELALKADISRIKMANALVPSGFVYFHTEETLKKFAELIVRKCIESTMSLHNTAIDNEWNLDETFHVIVDTIVEDLDMQHIFRS